VGEGKGGTKTVPCTVRWWQLNSANELRRAVQDEVDSRTLKGPKRTSPKRLPSVGTWGKGIRTAEGHTTTQEEAARGGTRLRLPKTKTVREEKE